MMDHERIRRVMQANQGRTGPEGALARALWTVIRVWEHDLSVSRISDTVESLVGLLRGGRDAD